MTVHSRLEFCLSKQYRSFSDLPYDLLSDISDRLGLIELLCFRSLCKNTRSASSNSSAAIEEQSYSPFYYPWFLLYGDNGPLCSIVTNNNNKHYKIDLPDIADSTCVFSHNGWLLFLSPDSSMFFFCPFSKSRINLPNCPFASTDLNFAAAFSHSPTHRDCAVVVLRWHLAARLSKLELCLLRRGDTEWSPYEYHNPFFRTGGLKSVMHHQGAFSPGFHFVGLEGVVIFNDKSKSWSHYSLMWVRNTDNVDENEVVYRTMKYRFSSKSKEMKLILGIEEACSVIICGTLIFKTGCEYYLIDHEKYCEGISNGNERRLKGVWIQPRFHQIPPNQSWSL